jgi:major membrane immunogen (membrane-anchored lipoprotein)
MQCVTRVGLATIVLAAVLLTGCGADSQHAGPTTKPDAAPTAPDGHGHDRGHDHGHASEGPHHGDLVELGDEEYHAEVVHSTDEVAVYLLGPDAKTAVPIEATELVVNLVRDGKPAQVQLTAAPDKGDPTGRSSRFVSQDAALAQHLDEKGAHARLSVTIAGKHFSGKIVHDHQHDHGHGDAKGGDRK